jgi:hypothetical protein
LKGVAAAGLALALMSSDGLAGVFPPGPFSDKAAGTSGAAFLRMSPGARAMALGGSFAAGSGGSESVFLNPAGLARMEGEGLSEAGASYNALLETSYSGTFALARPISAGLGTWAASMIYFSQSPLQGYNTVGDPTSSWTPYDIAVGGAYGKTLGFFGENCLRLGAGAKLIRSSLQDHSGTSFSLDFGMLADGIADVGDTPVDLGVSVRDLGPPIRLYGTADPLPFQAAAGIQWHASPSLICLFDGHFPVDADPFMSLGVEVSAASRSGAKGFLRAGYDMRNQRGIDGLSGVSAGLGADLHFLRVDYAWVPFGELGTTHRFSLGGRFGGVSPGRGASARPFDALVRSFRWGIEKNCRRKAALLGILSPADEEGLGGLQARLARALRLQEGIEILEPGRDGLRGLYGASDKARVRELGMMGVPCAIIGSVDDRGDSVEVSARLVDTGGGGTLLSERALLPKEPARPGLSPRQAPRP